MKIRAGFVSNSSSSSFVVAFKKEPKTVEDVKKALFEDYKEYFHPYDHIHYSAWQVAETVFEDIQEQKANSKKEISEAFSGWLEGQPQYENFTDTKGDIDWGGYEKANKKFQDKLMKKFMEENLNSFIYSFNYEDNNGAYFCALEHGDLFHRLPNIKISCH